ncbi:MAG: hypothetical protein ACLUIQ_09130 [Dialister invisus]
MEIRKATIDDLALVSAVEAEVFSCRGGDKDSFKERYLLRQSFRILLKGKIDFLCGRYETNLADLTDEMYEKADMHDEHGAWQMIFG